MHASNLTQTKKTMAGMTLIEALIALLVLSIGLLGTAHLMATSIKFTNSSFARTQATLIAENLAERMRANSEGVLNGTYNGFNSAASYPSCNARPNPYCEVVNGVAAAACTADQLAVFDLYQATCGSGGSDTGSSARDVLPNGQIGVTCNDAPCTVTSTYTLTVSWNEMEDMNGNDVLNVNNAQFVIMP